MAESSGAAEPAVGGRGAGRARLVIATATAGVLVLGAAACGDDDEEGLEVLPPIRTTTTLATTTTTISTERQFYEIKPGETLSVIAARFEVPVVAIVELNGIENPDNVPAGQVIEIPTGVRLITDLPEAGAESTAPG